MTHSISKKFNFTSLILFALPTIIMMMVMSLYTIIDGFFIAQFVGTDALSATNIVYPVINIVIGVAIMLATGGNAIVARKMGEGKIKEARTIFTFIIIISLIIGGLIALAGNLLIEPLVLWLGASKRILSDCITYLSVLLWFSPAFILQLMFQTFFVTEGKPGIGLLLTVIAGLTNAVFDYILIVPMNLGILGAALATAMGYMIPAIVGLIYFFSSRSHLYFVRPVWSGRVFLESCSNGSSEMVSNLSSGVVTFLFNLLMMRFAGEDGVAAITIIQYAQFLLNALFMGFSQGIAPVISFNHGSKNHDQLKRVFRYSLIFLAGTSLFIFAVSVRFGDYIVILFTKPDSPVFELAQTGFFIFAFSFLFSGGNIFASSMFTALSDGKTSAIISVVRTFGLIVASLLLLPLILGVTGVWLAVPIAEAGCILLSAYYFIKYRHTYHYA